MYPQGNVPCVGHNGKGTQRIKKSYVEKTCFVEFSKTSLQRALK